MGTWIEISKSLSVGSQLQEGDLPELQKRGFRSIVNLQTKGELGSNFSLSEEAKASHELGFQYLHFPVSLSRLRADLAAEFLESIGSLPAPIFLHCRMGQISNPFGILLHAKNEKLSKKIALQRAHELGLAWEVPTVHSFMDKALADLEQRR